MTIEMSQDQKAKLKALLIKHEDDRNYPYYDTLGNISIGIGRNLTGIGVRQDEKELMYNNDVNFFYDYLMKTYPWFHELNEARQNAIIDMSFMGTKHFESFTKMIEALHNHDYQMAACEILDSDYAKKETKRANDIANIILIGID